MDTLITILIQFTVGAPGEVFVFDVAAFDEAGNQQAAIWNINELSNSAAEREVCKYMHMIQKLESNNCHDWCLYFRGKSISPYR